jgi:hypothetical protein
MNEELLQLLQGNEDHYPHALEEQFPRILNKIIIMWGSPELDQYFSELLMDSRGGTRQGFPPNIASEIFNLSMAHSGKIEGP